MDIKNRKYKILLLSFLEKLYILHLYYNKLELPIINDNFIGIIMNLISTRKTNQ